ncbi:acid phosphatase [Methylocella sp.]|uniref:acid phosphatase n=1 Tax=Methylocella sp. TaxID=1978226 RepID=UPI0035AF4F62
MRGIFRFFALAAGAVAAGGATAHAEEAAAPQAAVDALARIKTVVVIYAENRSFNNLWGLYPGADGVRNAQAAAAFRRQKDRDGSILKVLPPVWGGLTAPGVTPPVTEAQTENMPNKPFRIDDPKGYDVGLDKVTRDLWHRFYQNQMQINNGANDKFAAWADSGGLVMGHYDSSDLPLWKYARRYTLADHFFMGAFGGSYLNHQYLICSCAPRYAHADTSVAKGSIAAVNPDGVSLQVASGAPPSAIDGAPKFVNDGAITPDFYTVNTMQPPYQPSAVKPASGQDPRYADRGNASVLPPQRNQTIGDLLTGAGVTWAWYGGAWQATLDGQNASPVPNFQYHHQPFNYYAAYAPGSAARAEHLKDGGLGGVKFIADIDAGKLPAVSFYKPQGNLNEHPGYADVLDGDSHIADILRRLEKSPQWRNMLVVVTYDENGGFWDHVAPPKGDRFGPGSRIPALIVSPYAKKGYVDHTVYDTTSIIRFLTRRYDLPVLAGVRLRDAAVRRQGGQPIGDLTGALQ